MGRSLPRGGVLGRVLLLLAGAVLLGIGSSAAPLRAQPSGATEVKVFVPFVTTAELNPNLHVQSRESFPPPFECQSGAASTTRPDAWRCGTADPCFAPPFAPADAQTTTLACAGEGPWSGEVVLLTVQGPLRSEEDCRTPPLCRQPLDLERTPWALELANGARCRLLTGTAAIIGGFGWPYLCEGGYAGGIAPTIDRGGPVWRVFFLPTNGFAAEQVDVLVAWY